MDKESIYMRQCIDCNCNDCKFFSRDNEALNRSKQVNRDYCAWSLRVRRRYFWEEAQKQLKNGNQDKHAGLLKERARVTVDKSYKTGLVFGNCAKLKKPIQTVPNVCQPDTQQCFEHRRS